jgi:hypothetical protein
MDLPALHEQLAGDNRDLPHVRDEAAMSTTNTKHWIERIELEGEFEDAVPVATICCRDTSEQTRVTLDLMEPGLIDLLADKGPPVCRGCGRRIELHIIVITPKQQESEHAEDSGSGIHTIGAGRPAGSGAGTPESEGQSMGEERHQRGGAVPETGQPDRPAGMAPGPAWARYVRPET